MADGVTIKTSGLTEMINKLNTLAKDEGKTAAMILQSSADIIISEAKVSAPADLGKIRQNLSWQNIGTGTNVQIKLFCNAPEAIFQEFGTGPQVYIPNQFSEVAATGQNSGSGTWADFIIALTDWVKRHGINPIGNYIVSTKTRIGRGNKKDIDTEAAYMIARAILIRGLKPQPFLYPAILNNVDAMLTKLDTAYKQLLTA